MYWSLCTLDLQDHSGGRMFCHVISRVCVAKNQKSVWCLNLECQRFRACSSFCCCPHLFVYPLSQSTRLSYILEDADLQMACTGHALAVDIGLLWPSVQRLGYSHLAVAASFSVRPMGQGIAATLCQWAQCCSPVTEEAACYKVQIHFSVHFFFSPCVLPKYTYVCSCHLLADEVLFLVLFIITQSLIAVIGHEVHPVIHVFSCEFTLQLL